MKKNLSRMGLPVGFLVLILLLLVPTPPDLSTAGHRMLAILVFSVIIWMTEAVAYPVSSGIIMSLMAFLLGTAPIWSTRRRCSVRLAPSRWRWAASRAQHLPSSARLC